MNPWRPWLLAIPAAAGVTLTIMGQRLWCKCGTYWPWSGEVYSMHNSQHLADPYTFTHILHGFLFLLLTVPIASRVSPTVRLAIVMGIESLWEIAENTDTIINRYREATISLDYFGDSVLNSMSDIAACTVGYLVAQRLPWWGALLAFLATEAALAAWIRDGLLLNMIMLVHPVEAIKAWQSGG